MIMKKVILLISVVIIFIDPSNAQLIRNYGLKFAFTSASQTFEYANPPFPGFGPSKVRRAGFNVGFFVEWFNIPFLSVLSQIEYTQRGVGEEYYITEDGPVPVGTRTDFRRVDYLSIPILLKFNVPLGVVTPYLIAGPRADFLLGYQDNQTAFNSLYKNFKKSLIGGSIGLGLESGNFLPIDLSAEFRYNADFSNSFDNEYLRVRNNAFDVWLGVAF